MQHKYMYNCNYTKLFSRLRLFLVLYEVIELLIRYNDAHTKHYIIA